MDKLIFVTGNKSKVKEARMILSDFEIEQKEMEIPELQGHRDIVIKEKARLAAEKLSEACFVEDTSLCFTALNDLPGVYIKEFANRLRLDGLVKMLSAYEDKSAKAIVMIGFCEPGKEPICFEGVIKGTIVEPRGEKRFVWDPIFQPDGYDKTFAEMSQEEKNKISHRKKALVKFKEFLEDNK